MEETNVLNFSMDVSCLVLFLQMKPRPLVDFAGLWVEIIFSAVTKAWHHPLIVFLSEWRSKMAFSRSAIACSCSTQRSWFTKTWSFRFSSKMVNSLIRWWQVLSWSRKSVFALSALVEINCQRVKSTQAIRGVRRDGYLIRRGRS